MRKGIALTVLLIGVSALAFGQISVLNTTGLVEVQTAGGWEIVQAGDELARNAVIATGFRSSAVLQIGSSRVTVEPLSELTIAELASSGGNESVALSLPFGRIRAEVNKESNVSAIDFRVTSPVSTAAVRGTTFDYDGVALNVLDGRVALSNAYGQWHSVAAGQESRAYRWTISSVEAVAAEQAAGE